jgi:uncharacterized protein YjiK
MLCLAAWRIALATLFTVSLLACSPPAAEPARTPSSRGSLFASAPTVEWRLPDRLREISGLALTADGRLFAHDDERAVLYEVDVNGGRVRRSFAVGDPVEHGDFEDLAITPEGDFWLATSRGKLLRFREGAEGAHVPFERFDSGVSNICEMEGVAYLASAHSLILACKDNQARDMRHTLALYAWPIAGNAPATLWRTIPESAVTRAAGVREFHPSSVTFDGATGRLLLLSARDGAFAELSPDGELIAARRLGGEHRQAEGMIIAPDASLIISDEANGGPALIAVYGRLQ